MTKMPSDYWVPSSEPSPTPDRRSGGGAAHDGTSDGGSVPVHCEGIAAPSSGKAR